MKTKEEIYGNLISNAKTQSPTLHWVPHAPQTDVLISIVNEIYRMEGLLDYTNSISALERYKKLIADSTRLGLIAEATGISEANLRAQLSADLEAKLAEWAFYRKTATHAIGSLKLEFPTTVTLAVDSGAMLETLAGLRYLTTEAISGVPIPIEEGYALYIMAESEFSGTQGNVPEGTYFRSSEIPGLIRAIALHEIINGQDEETDIEFIDRFIKARKQEGIGSKSWLLRTVLEHAQVVDAIVYGLGDKHFYRDYGADVWVQDLEVPLTLLEKAMPKNGKHRLLTGPLTEYPTFTGLKANTNPIRVLSWNDRSVLDIVDVEPDEAWIEYTIDKVIKDLQATLGKPDNWLLGGYDLVLIKKAYERPINIEVEIAFNPDMTQTEKETTKGTIISDLEKFFSGGAGSDGTSYLRKKLAVNIDWSDLLEVILRVEGVDRVPKDKFMVKVKGFIFYGSSMPISDSGEWIEANDPVSILYHEFATFGKITITEEIPAEAGV